MSRVLKILSLAVIIFLAYMGISLMTKSCNSTSEKKQAITSKNEEKKQDIFEDEEFFAEEDTTSGQAADGIDYKELDQSIADSKNDAKQNKEISQPVSESELPPTTAKEKLPSTTAKEKTPPTTKPAAPTTKAVDPKSKITQKPVAVSKPAEVTTAPRQSKESLTGTGDFVVVAGNYLLEANADQMVKKLKNNGFNGSEKVVFDLSEFFTVIAGKYTTYESATKAVSNLKAKGIDCYIHRKK